MADPDPQIPVLEALIAFAQVQLTEAWAEVRDQNTYALALAAVTERRQHRHGFQRGDRDRPSRSTATGRGQRQLGFILGQR
jgi:hypothetical protein